MVNSEKPHGRQNKLVGDVMDTNVVTCAQDTPIPQVAQLMTQHDVSAVPVIDEESYLVGIISRTDLVMLRAHDDYWRAMSAEHVMMHEVVTITPGETVAEASKRMIDRRIHRLIVVRIENQRAKPIGVISQTDVVRDMALE